jgi:small subunit ribosomal protein S18
MSWNLVRGEERSDLVRELRECLRDGPETPRDEGVAMREGLAESWPTPATLLLYVRRMAAKSKRRKDTEPGARPARPGGGQAKVFRRKSCLFCKDKVREVDYKNVEQLRRYTSDRGKIRSRRMSGACRRHQRQVAVAIKRAREMALLPYVAEGGGPPPSRSRSGERR